MQTQIILEDEYLSAFKIALECAGKDDTRYYLNGVYLEPNKNRMTATDGHRMFVSNIADEMIEVEGNDPVIVGIYNPVTNKRVDRLPKSWKKVIIDFETMTISDPLKGSLAIKIIDGRFPECSRVVSSAVNENLDPNFYEISYNPRLISSLVEAAGFSPTSMVEKTYRTSKSGMFFQFADLGITHFGILMPSRYDVKSSVYTSISALGF